MRDGCGSTARRVGAITLIAAGCLSVASIAGASPGGRHAVPIAATGWYFKDTVEQVGLPTDPSAGEEPTNVPSGDLAVAADGRDATTKETYVALDLSGLPSGANITSLRLTLSLDKASAQQGGDEHALLACRPKTPFASGPDQDWSGKPTDDCSAAPPSHYSAGDRRYDFDLTSQAITLASPSSTGIGIVPAPIKLPVQQPWQLVFRRVTVTVAYTAPAAASSTTTSTNPTSGAKAGGTSSGTGSGGASGGGISLPSGSLPSGASTSSTGGDDAPPVVAGAPSTSSSESQVTTQALVIPTSQNLPAGFLLALLAGLAAAAGLAVLLTERDVSSAG